ncbi:LLM class F420-dependent oxidoreductase [Actinomadura chibensis]|nr:LLM class F420-dependent oxidoreductase [Actinomadura chibensis]
MKFGLPMYGLSPRHQPEAARVAEENGYESVWVPEHLVLPAELPSTYLYTADGRPPIEPRTPMYDPWVVLAAIAASTERIRLATNVYVLPLRHPVITARSVVTLDRVSGGRVTLGVGVGWLAEEFGAVGMSFHDRGDRTDEVIPLLRRLWSEETVEHKGRHYAFGPVAFEPKPVQRYGAGRGIPIEVGGTSPPALRRAGRLGDGWIEIGARDLDDVARMLAVVRAARAEAGRTDEPFEVTCSLPGDLDTVRRAAELGVTRVVAAPVRGHTGRSGGRGGSSPHNDAGRSGGRGGSSPHSDAGRATKEDVLDGIKRFADEVIARTGDG